MSNTAQRVERRPSGWRYVIIGILTFVFAASLLLAGIVLGGGASILDRLAGGLGLIPAAVPTPTIISGDAVVQQIRRISRLETTTYTIERVIEARQSDPVWPDWLRGDRLLLIANGTVIAGVDMEKLQAEDVVVSADGKAVTITLPSAEIFNADAILNNAKTRVYDRQQGLLAPPNANLETDARRAAEGQLLAAACEEGIMARATEDAREAVATMLSLFELEATVVARPAPPCPG
jgi:hypothetical protein